LSTLSSIVAALALDVASLEFTGLKLQGPLPALPPAKGGDASAPAWSLGPLATAEGAIGAEIVDAHLIFDAKVTVPIRQGRIRFNDATVEHVGPDSRMGVSRLGIYVDAPNGRSYLYQFPSAQVAGVEYERRGALLGAMVSDRGSLLLQAFAEALLRQLGGGEGLGITEQARLLFDRTAVKGEVRLGDGKLVAPGAQAELQGRAKGHNTVRLNSQAVGRGLVAEIDALSVRDAMFQVGDRALQCDEITGALALRLLVEGKQVRFALDVARLKLSGLRLRAA
jgi:hypothetical protein